MALANPKPTSLTKRDVRRKELADRFLNAVSCFRTSDAWQQWLHTRRHLRRYSLRNQLLIRSQRPNATRVMGYRKWTTFGRAVNRGAKAIWIWGPASVKTRNVDDAGEPTRRTIFVPVPVFDIADTHPIEHPNPRPLEPPFLPVTGDTTRALLAWDALVQHAHTIGYTVTLADCGDSDGYCDYSTRNLVIEQDLDATRRVATLIHELAHAHDPNPTNRHIAEFTAETVAYTVCEYIGIDNANAIPYVTGWTEQLTDDELAAHLTHIDNIARTLESTLHNLLRADS